jgi:hypothetical protein
VGSNSTFSAELTDRQGREERDLSPPLDFPDGAL